MQGEQHNLVYLLVAGLCVAHGFSGCCTVGFCYVPLAAGGVCYCDQICHAYRDCCSDIEEAGCFPNTTLASTWTGW